MEIKGFYIYVLSDSTDRTKNRYVGLTSRPVIRFKQHCNSFKYSNTKKSAWIKQVISNGSFIEIGLIEYCSSLNEAKEREKYHIARLKASGSDLVNSTEGGTGTIGFKHSLESRMKMSNNLLGSKRHSIPHSESSRLLMSSIRRGKKVSEETKAKMRVAHLGRKTTSEQRLHMRQAWVLRKQHAHKI